MSRYIDQDKVLEYIIFGVVDKDITCGELKRAIESLPAIEVSKKTDDWIPVSEKLPEDRRDVLVYLSSRRMTIACYNDHKLPFRNKAIGWGYKPLQGKIDFDNEFVMAWKPLPEPYKESEDE